MDFSREKLVEIWQRVLPNDPPPEVFDTLAYPCGEPREAAQSGDYALFDDASERSGSRNASFGGHERSGGGRGAADAGNCADDARDPYGGEDSLRHGCAALRDAVERELELTALYHALARRALAHRGSRSLARRLMRLANGQFAAAKAAAGAHLLASGEYFFPAPPECEVASLREGLRRAWALERELVAAYARLETSDPSGGGLRQIHSERSLELIGLLGEVFG